MFASFGNIHGSIVIVIIYFRQIVIAHRYGYIHMNIWLAGFDYFLLSSSSMHISQKDVTSS